MSVFSAIVYISMREVDFCTLSSSGNLNIFQENLICFFFLINAGTLQFIYSITSARIPIPTLTLTYSPNPKAVIIKSNMRMYGWILLIAFFLNVIFSDEINHYFFLLCKNKTVTLLYFEQLYWWHVNSVL